MGLILAEIVAVVTLFLSLLTVLANGMSDAPGSPGISVWPTLIGGLSLAALLAVTHYVHIPW
jgi:hypothetical protein